MVKIGIINDIHGNVEALKRILDEMNKYHFDYIFCTGDMIGIGPSHNEVLEILSQIPNLEVVKGNHEDYYLHGFHNPGAALEEKFHNWVKDTMNHKYDSFLNSLEYLKIYNIEGFKIALLHYPRLTDDSKFHLIYPDKSYEFLLSLFSYIDADIYIYGHDHYPNILEKNKVLINIGSSGCSNINVGFTRFGILILDNKKYQIETKLIPYDIQPEIDLLEKENVPDKELIEKIFFKK